MVKVKITNSYHNTEEIEEGKSLEAVRNNYLGGVEFTARNLAENEVEEDWKDYYFSYEEALEETYELIYDELVKELKFEVVQ